MSKIFKNPQKNVKINVKKNKLKQILFVFLFILIDLLIVFNLADIFSSIITKEKGIFSSDKIEINSYSFYCVSSKHFLDEKQATLYADEIALKGAMGRVYKNGEYYVFAGIYPTLIDAQEVKENLLDLGYEARIVTFSIPSVLEKYKGKSKDILTNSIGVLKETVISMYNFCEDFDGGNIKRSNLNGKLACLCEKIDDATKNFSSNLSGLDKNFCQTVLCQLEFTRNKVGEVILFGEDFEKCSSLLKNNIFDIVLSLKKAFSSGN